MLGDIGGGKGAKHWFLGILGLWQNLNLKFQRTNYTGRRDLGRDAGVAVSEPKHAQD